MKQAAYFLLSPELLKEALHMPSDTHVFGADWNFAGDCLKIYVSHPSLKPVEAGETLPMVQPTVIKTPVGLEGQYEYKWSFNPEEK